ncbi:hypothetical protein DE146DRAFT_327486 [Phaeosphaeria sp. MPI-PUGE-AT-0046c]|nr:hypothetical protein DE146DRAFT_327486 [Phaeosphaeria sp. MPI-PUGE-AT-0046c]
MSLDRASRRLGKMPNTWQWSEQYKRYYRYEFRNGQSVCIWDNSGPAAAQASPRGRADSAADPNMAPAAPEEIRHHIVFRGTPEKGWYETLDSRFRVRTNAEEYQFFQKGRVLAMLWSEPAGETAIRAGTTDNSRYTAHPNSGIVEGRFGQKIYCQIRRFVVIRVNRQQHFVEACAITTYGNRGVLKPGCNPGEHTIVFSKGYQPQYMAGERERGMTKYPIAVEPGESGEVMSAASRLRFGKTYTIECNVKVRDMGMVVPEHKVMLLRYHQDERDNGFEADDDDEDDSQNTPNFYYTGQH